MIMAAPLIIGGLAGIGNFLAQSSANDRAMMLQDEAFQQWMKLNVPDPEQQKVVLDKFVNQGQLDPKLQSAIQQNPSEFQKIVSNSTYKGAQNRALSELENIGYEGGLRLQDKAALQDAMLHGQAQDRGNRDAVAAEMARRGLSGSGYDVMARLQSQQSGADRNANNSLKIAAQAQDRALQSIMGAGDLAGKYQAQDFSQQAQKASAADRINQFNTQNLRDVNASNIAAQNQAQQLNLANKQRISDENTKLANTQQMYNKNLIQQQYDNQMKKVAGATGQLGQQAATQQRGGEIAGNTISNIGGAAANAYGAQANYDLLSKYLDSNQGENGKKKKGSSPWAFGAI